MDKRIENMNTTTASDDLFFIIQKVCRCVYVCSNVCLNVYLSVRLLICVYVCKLLFMSVCLCVSL